MKTLKNVPVGKTVIVEKIHGEGALKRRILDMGITKGTALFIRKCAPFGDPIQINLRGFELTLRRNDAKLIEIQEV